MACSRRTWACACASWRDLAKDAEGAVVHVTHNPADEELVAAVRADRTASPCVYLKHVPLGLWLLMNKYKAASFTEQLEEACPSLTPEHTRRLAFLEPNQGKTFKEEAREQLESEARIWGCKFAHAEGDAKALRQRESRRTSATSR